MNIRRPGGRSEPAVRRRFLPVPGASPDEKNALEVLVCLLSPARRIRPNMTKHDTPVCPYLSPSGPFLTLPDPSCPIDRGQLGTGNQMSPFVPTCLDRKGQADDSVTRRMGFASSILGRSVTTPPVPVGSAGFAILPESGRNCRAARIAKATLSAAPCRFCDTRFLLPTTAGRCARCRTTVKATEAW